MQSIQPTTTAARNSLWALEAQRFGNDEPDASTGLLGSARIDRTSTDNGCCSRLWNRMAAYSQAHPRICNGLGVVGGMLCIVGAVITLEKNPDATAQIALLFTAGGVGILASTVHCIVDSRQAQR